MKYLLYVAIVLLAAGCNVKGAGSTTTTTGNVPAPALPATKNVNLNWSASTGTVQGYKIEASGDGVSFIELGSVAGNQLGVSISGLYVGSKYYFRIRSFNQGGNSNYGAVVPISL